LLSATACSVLTEFRARLLADGQTERLLGLMLDRLWERGLLARAGASAPTRPMSTWRCATFTGCKQVIETLRAALEALAVVAPAWLGGLIPRD
jgi:transposase